MSAPRRFAVAPQRHDDRDRDRRLAERPLLRAADVARPRRLRAVRRPADAARRAPRRGRAADPHLAGVQLPRRRRRRRRATPGTRRTGHLQARLGRPFLNRGVPPHYRKYDLALPALAAPDRPRRRRPLAGRARRHDRRTARRGLRPARLPRPPRVRDRRRVRRGRGLPQPRRQPDVPLREQLLLADRPARPDDDARRASGATSAGPRPACSACSTSATTRASTAARGSSAPAAASSWIFAGIKLARRQRASRTPASRSTRSRRARRAGRASSPRSRTCSAPGMTAHMTYYETDGRREGVRRRRVHARRLDPAAGGAAAARNLWERLADER